MGLFRPPFRDHAFDVVISNGAVIHHTGYCRDGFRSILAKLKPGGLILVGLYNQYARLPTLWKRQLFRHSMDKVLALFDRYGMDLINGIPHLDGSAFSGDKQLFAPHGAGTPATRFMVQASMLCGGGRDGGLFIMAGRKC